MVVPPRFEADPLLVLVVLIPRLSMTGSRFMFGSRAAASQARVNSFNRDCELLATCSCIYPHARPYTCIMIMDPIHRGRTYKG